MNIPEIQKDLLELKKGIDSAKISSANLKGRESELLNQLKKNHELSSEGEIDKALLKLDQEITKEASSIEADHTKLKEEYGW